MKWQCCDLYGAMATAAAVSGHRRQRQRCEKIVSKDRSDAGRTFFKWSENSRRGLVRRIFLSRRVLNRDLCTELEHIIPQ